MLESKSSVNEESPPIDFLNQSSLFFKEMSKKITSFIQTVIEVNKDDDEEGGDFTFFFQLQINEKIITIGKGDCEAFLLTPKKIYDLATGFELKNDEPTKEAQSYDTKTKANTPNGFYSQGPYSLSIIRPV